MYYYVKLETHIKNPTVIFFLFLSTTLKIVWFLVKWWGAKISGFHPNPPDRILEMALIYCFVNEINYYFASCILPWKHFLDCPVSAFTLRLVTFFNFDREQVLFFWRDRIDDVEWRNNLSPLIFIAPTFLSFCWDFIIQIKINWVWAGLLFCHKFKGRNYYLANGLHLHFLRGIHIKS